MKKLKIFIFVLLSILIISIIDADNINAENIDPVTIDPELEDKLEDGSARVFVKLKDNEEIGVNIFEDNPKKRTLKIKDNQEKVLSKLISIHEKHASGIEENNTDFILRWEYDNINGFSGNITKKGLKKLIEDPSVESITLDKFATVSLEQSIPIINSDDVWNLSLNGINITGKGVSVCVLDTGINYSHPNLGNCSTAEFLAGSCKKVPFGFDFANNDNDPMDDHYHPVSGHSHGSHCSGIIASDHNTYRGVAPDTKILAIKVCYNSGGCALGDIAQGVDWCISNKNTYNVSAISISIGTKDFHSSTYCDNYFPALSNAINTAHASGIPVFISSGNELDKDEISFPSCVTNATAIGAVDDSDNDASFSNFAPILNFFAPGVSIISTVRGGSFGLFASKSGTSMATPHVSGAAALITSFKRLEGNNITPEELIEALNQTGKPINISGVIRPRIDILAALAYVDESGPDILIKGNAETNKESYLYNVTIVDVNNISDCWISWENINYSMTKIGEGRKVVCSGYINGSEEVPFTIYANDTKGHLNKESAVIKLNNSAPKILSWFPLNTNTSIVEPDNQTFNITFNDMEGDNVTVLWYLNSTLVSNTSDYNFIGNYSSAGRYNITSVVSDRFSSSIIFWILTVNNTNRKPNISSAFITPEDPGIGLNLTCNNGSWYDPDQENVTLFYDWHNGSWLGINKKTIPGNLVNIINATWNCSIIIFDGIDNSTKAVSPSVKISNTPPNITSKYPDIFDVNIAEPQSQIFNITYTDNNLSTVTVSWYVNSVKQAEDTTEYTFPGSFTSEGTYNITVSLDDGTYTSSNTWNLTINNSNSAPSLISNIPDQRWYMDENLTINLSLYFEDADLDALIYDQNTFPDNITVVITGDIANIIPDTGWTGTRTIKFNATDNFESENSNVVQLDITKDLDGDGQDSTTFGGIDCADDNDQIFPGAECTKTCYTGTTYSTNCACTGGTYNCGSSTGSCFLEQTKILMYDNSYKPIENIKKGELVIAYDEKEDIQKTGKVIRTFIHKNIPDYLIINKKLKVTPNHPLLVNGIWKQAGEIDQGDILIDKNNDPITVESIEKIENLSTVYNLEIENYHTYYAEDILVHNKGGGVASTTSKTWKSSHYFSEIFPNQTNIMNINNMDISITKINFSTNIGRERVTVVTQRLNGSEIDISIREQLGNVFHYIEIEFQNLNEEEAVLPSIVEFRVSKSWLDKNGFDKKSVILFRYHNKWQALDAEIIKETDGYVYYRSDVPGFSLFAITAQKKPTASISEEDSKDITKESSDSDTLDTIKKPQTENAAETNSAPTFDPSGTQDKNNTGWKKILVNIIKWIFIAILAVTILLILTIIIYSPKKERESLRKLEHYIIHRISLGHLEEEIKTDLHKLGWSIRKIEKHFAKALHLHSLVRLEHYIGHRISSGHFEHEIKNDLHGLGWSKKHVKKHYNKAKNKVDKINDELKDLDQKIRKEESILKGKKQSKLNRSKNKL